MHTGKIVSHYEILEEIGAGGMGVVYKARDLRLDRLVAVKMLAPDKLGDPGQQERFVREAKTASALNHPNIVTIHEIDVSEGIQLIAMEYVEGMPLAGHIAPGGLPVLKVIDYALQITEAMAKAHNAGITHRDLKPGNIMITAEGRVKILDFGLAKRQIGSDDRTVLASLTTSGLVVGTVAYMAPEQALGEAVDGRSDIFSLGIILFEMLAGDRPYTAKTAIGTIQKILSEPPPSLASFRRDIPSAVEAILAKALEKRPAGRYQTMEELRADLLKVLQGKRRIGIRLPPVVRALAWTAIVSVLSIAITILIATEARPLVQWMFSGNRGAVVDDPLALPASAMTPIEWVRRGSEFARRSDFPENVDRAIALYRKALERDPNYAAAHAALAEAYLQKDASKPDPQWIRLATDSAANALNLNPDLTAAHLAQGRLLVQTKKPDEGATEFQKALELEPRSATANLRLAEYYLTKGDARRAADYYSAAEKLDPNDWVIFQSVGRFHYRNAQYEEAVRMWERGLALAPDNVVLYRNLGGAYHMLDRWEEAASAFQRALEIQPSAATAGAYTNIGTVRFFQGHYKEAVAAFEKAVELNPTWYLYWGNLADAHRWIPGNEKRAKDAYARAIELTRERISSTRNDPELISSLAVYYAKSGDKSHAAETLAELEMMANRTPGTYFKALVAYEVIGNRELALKALSAALKAQYSVKEIKTEPELSALRSDRRYHEILQAASKP